MSDNEPNRPGQQHPAGVRPGSGSGSGSGDPESAVDDHTVVVPTSRRQPEVVLRPEATTGAAATPRSATDTATETEAAAEAVAEDVASSGAEVAPDRGLPLDDRTIVVASSRAKTTDPGAHDAPDDDLDPLDVLDDRTVVVPAARLPVETEVDDQTIVVPTRASGASEDPAAANRRDRADAVNIDGTAFDGTIVAAKMFKRPRNRPLPTTDATTQPGAGTDEQRLPRRGVRPSMPVVYTKRSGAEITADPVREATLELRIGPPPALRMLPAAEREGLPSTARANTRFRRRVIIGLACSVAVSAVGLWCVATVAFG